MQPLQKRAWQFHQKLNIHLTYDPAILLPGIYPREMNIHVYMKIYVQMFIAALFVTAPNKK